MVSVAAKNINGMKFSTWDNCHDNSGGLNCAKDPGTGSGHISGWWYNSCALGEPNGSGAKFFRWNNATSGAMTLQTSRMLVSKVGT